MPLPLTPVAIRLREDERGGYRAGKSLLIQVQILELKVEEEAAKEAVLTARQREKLKALRAGKQPSGK
jgi:hypothetical protein